MVHYIYQLFAHWVVNEMRHQDKEQMAGGGGMEMHCIYQVNLVIQSYRWRTTSGYCPLFVCPSQ